MANRVGMEAGSQEYLEHHPPLPLHHTASKGQVQWILRRKGGRTEESSTKSHFPLHDRQWDFDRVTFQPTPPPSILETIVQWLNIEKDKWLVDHFQ